MIMKRMLKFSFSALLLAAGVTAFAEGGVTLSNGTAISWSQFVEDLNNPPKSATGVVPEDADVRKTLSEKKTANEEAGTLKSNALKDLNDAKDTQTEKAGVLKGKNETLTTAQETLQTETNKLVDAAQGNLDEARANLEAYKKELSDSVAKKTGYEADKKDYEDKIIAAQNTLRTLNASKNALPKKTETSTGTAPWLKSINTAAKAFLADYNAAAADRTNKPKIYYKLIEIQPEEEWESATTSLTIAFAAPANLTGWTGPASQADLRTLYSTLNKKGTTTIGDLYIYLGSKYAEEEGDETKWVASDVALANILKNAVNSVASVAADGRFQETITTVLDEYQDPDAAQAIQDDIDDTQNLIKGYQKQIDGVYKDENGELPEGETKAIDGLKYLISNAGDKITELEGEISNLENTIIPGYEKDVEDAPNSDSLNKYKQDVTDAQDEVDTAQEEADNADAEVERLQAAYDDAEANAETAKTEFEKAEAALEQAQKDADTAALASLLNAYKRVTLTDNVNVETPINEYYGTILGNGHVINVPTGAIFHTFGGSLSNVAINGSTFEDNDGARFTNVARWNGTGGILYGEETADRTTFTALDELAYAARARFGVSFAENKLAEKTAETTVYSITVYEPTKQTQHYVQILSEDGKQFYGSKSKEFSIPVNMFAESATGEDAICAIPNVYYNGRCNNAVITDREAFYAPVDITVGTVDYSSREFKEGMNAVCLPFDMDYSYCPANTTLSTYEEEDETTFWFKKQANGKVIPANTPLLVKAPNTFTLDLPEDVVFKATPKSQLVEGEGSVDDSRSFGTFANTNCADIATEKYSGNKVYGLSQGTFKLAAATAIFPAFRMVIRSENTRQDQANAARRIRIVDEKGIEITDETSGIATPGADATSFSVVGGQGEIKITSEADYGDVAIYSLDGKMIKVANVMAGTTSVNLQQGVYIVLGKKVMVK